MEDTFKEDTHHAAFISSHCQLSKVAAIRHWKGPASPGEQYQISFSRPWELEVLEGNRVLLLPCLQCICVSVLQLEMEEDSVPSAAENRNICP